MYLHPHRAKFESCVRLDGSGLIQVGKFLRDMTQFYGTAPYSSLEENDTAVCIQLLVKPRAYTENTPLVKLTIIILGNLAVTTVVTHS